jgi:site-specific DNA recombinase
MGRKRAQGMTVEGLTGAAPVRLALYLRVSTEDQAERGTIRAQMDLLRSKVDLDNRGREMAGQPPIIIAGEYADDGISGAVPFGERPMGKRLLEDARAGLFRSVLVYRLDRLGRRLRVLMDAHDTLEAAGVAIVSARSHSTRPLRSARRCSSFSDSWPSLKSPP